MIRERFALVSYIRRDDESLGSRSGCLSRGRGTDLGVFAAGRVAS
jgi:hypothetical protein